MHQRVEVHPAQVPSRAVWIIHRAEVGPDIEAMLDAADRCRERAAAMCEQYPQLRQPFERPGKDQRADGP